MTAHDTRDKVISVPLPRDLIERANQVIPKTRRSRVIAAVLTTFLDSTSRRKLAEAYATYYAKRPGREVEAERDRLAEWSLSHAETWAILDQEGRRGGRGASPVSPSRRKP
jgi:metal-responsive CopG/Arc/MetJ family transcriptional regulator